MRGVGESGSLPCGCGTGRPIHARGSDDSCQGEGGHHFSIAGIHHRPCRQSGVENAGAQAQKFGLNGRRAEEDDDHPEEGFRDLRKERSTRHGRPGGLAESMSSGVAAHPNCKTCCGWDRDAMDDNGGRSGKPAFWEDEEPKRESSKTGWVPQKTKDPLPPPRWMDARDPRPDLESWGVGHREPSSRWSDAGCETFRWSSPPSRQSSSRSVSPQQRPRTQCGLSHRIPPKKKQQQQHQQQPQQQTLRGQKASRAATDPTTQKSDRPRLSYPASSSPSKFEAIAPHRRTTLIDRYHEALTRKKCSSRGGRRRAPKGVAVCSRCSMALLPSKRDEKADHFFFGEKSRGKRDEGLCPLRSPGMAPLEIPQTGSDFNQKNQADGGAWKAIFGSEISESPEDISPVSQGRENPANFAPNETLQRFGNNPRSAQSDALDGPSRSDFRALHFVGRDETDKSQNSKTQNDKTENSKSQNSEQLFHFANPVPIRSSPATEYASKAPFSEKESRSCEFSDARKKLSSEPSLPFAAPKTSPPYEGGGGLTSSTRRAPSGGYDRPHLAAIAPSSGDASRRTREPTWPGDPEGRMQERSIRHPWRPSDPLSATGEVPSHHHRPHSATMTSSQGAPFPRENLGSSSREPTLLTAGNDSFFRSGKTTHLETAARGPVPVRHICTTSEHAAKAASNRASDSERPEMSGLAAGQSRGHGREHDGGETGDPGPRRGKDASSLCRRDRSEKLLPGGEPALPFRCGEGACPMGLAPPPPLPCWCYGWSSQQQRQQQQCYSASRSLSCCCCCGQHLPLTRSSAASSQRCVGMDLPQPQQHWPVQRCYSSMMTSR